MKLDKDIDHLLKDEFIQRLGHPPVEYPHTLSGDVVFGGVSELLRGRAE